MRRTSQTDPLQVAEIPVGKGKIGITFAPGKKQPNAASGAWDRDLDVDLDALKAWNAAAVVTLLEAHELASLEIPNLGRAVESRGMSWHHWPIRDVSTPGEGFESDWPQNARALAAQIEKGSNVLIHCKGGLGRAGMIAARLLVEMGLNPEEAIARVRAARSLDAIETPAQERWVHTGPV